MFYFVCRWTLDAVENGHISINQLLLSRWYLFVDELGGINVLILGFHSIDVAGCKLSGIDNYK